MRLTEEIDNIEQRMAEDDARADGFLFSASVALGCFGLLLLCWAIAMVMP